MGEVGAANVTLRYRKRTPIGNSSSNPCWAMNCRNAGIGVAGVFFVGERLSIQCTMWECFRQGMVFQVMGATAIA